MPVKLRAGFAVMKNDETSLEVLRKMNDTELPLKMKKEDLMKSEVFVDPSAGKVQDYMKKNHPGE